MTYRLAPLANCRIAVLKWHQSTVCGCAIDLEDSGRGAFRRFKYHRRTIFHGRLKKRTASWSPALFRRER
jgi:hypothetical protein